METLHWSLMARADYFEAACLRRAKIECERLRGDSIVTTPMEKMAKTKRQRKRAARAGGKR